MTAIRLAIVSCDRCDWTVAAEKPGAAWTDHLGRCPADRLDYRCGCGAAIPTPGACVGCSLTSIDGGSR